MLAAVALFLEFDAACLEKEKKVIDFSIEKLLIDAKSIVCELLKHFFPPTVII